MKHIYRLLLVLSVILGGTITGFAQLAPDTIVVEFPATKPIGNFTQVKHGQKVVMVLKNVNQNVFKVEGETAQTNHNIELPAIFTGVKLPAGLNLRLPAVSQDADTQDALASPMDNRRGVSYQKLVEDNLRQINAAGTVISDAIGLNNHIVNLVQSCNQSYPTIVTELLRVVNAFLDTTIADRETQVSELGLRLNGAIGQAVQAKAALDTLLPLYINDLNTTIIKPNNLKISQWDDEPTPKKNPNHERDILDYWSNKEQNEDVKEYISALNKIVGDASELVETLKKFRDDNRIYQLISNYRLINYSNFNFASDEIDVDSDEIKFTINVTSDKPLPCNIPSKLTISETYKTKGGLKIDFSTGAFFNFGNQDFLGRDIQYKPVNDSTKIIQAKDGGSRALLSVGAFMHIYKRSGTNCNLAFSPGLSTTAGFDALNFHLGASVIFGRKDRFVITGGTTLREAKILDKNYSFEKEYRAKLLPEAPPTIAVFPRWGYFFSLTYNWSKLKKQG